MSKNCVFQPNEEERKVLEAIQHNSNHNIEQLARKCGFNTQKVLKIKKRLENNKIIWGYAAVTDYQNLDLQHFIVLFKKSNIPFDKKVIKEITMGLLEDVFPEGNINIENVLYVHGEYDWVISFTTHDKIIMKRFCERLLKVYGNYISDYKIHQTVIPIRKHGIKNPFLKEQSSIL